MLVKNAGKLWKSHSVRGGVAGVLLLVQDIVPIWEGIVPDNTFTIMGAVAVSLSVIGRFIEQGLRSDGQ